jgi:aryl-alcohol dehydrogenase-like predicted oxidoreductase
VEFPEGDYRGTLGREKLDDMADQAERVRIEEVPPGTSMAAWALSWCLKHEAVACVIPGARDEGQLRGNAAAADLVADGHPLDI